jgi:hypothetical protein
VNRDPLTLSHQEQAKLDAAGLGSAQRGMVEQSVRAGFPFDDALAAAAAIAVPDFEVRDSADLPDFEPLEATTADEDRQAVEMREAGDSPVEVARTIRSMRRHAKRLAVVDRAIAPRRRPDPHRRGHSRRHGKTCHVRSRRRAPSRSPGGGDGDPGGGNDEPPGLPPSPHLVRRPRRGSR